MINNMIITVYVRDVARYVLMLNCSLHLLALVVANCYTSVHVTGIQVQILHLPHGVAQ
jgi:hypothetical protein